MREREVTQQDIGRRVVWHESPHLDRRGELKGLSRGGELIVKLDRPIKRGGKPPFNVVTVPAGQCELARAEGESEARADEK
jgi:hypothetical protein